jgi:hypothetical protein
VPLEHDGVYARPVQELAEQQAGRAGAYDRDLGPHVSVRFCPPLVFSTPKVRRAAAVGRVAG